MEPIKAIIVEDNHFMAAILHALLRQHKANISILGIAKTGKDALKLITSKKPNVVFLDVELPDMTGFEMLRQIDDINFQTIFTSSHSSYAINAFRVNALDYLIKPIKETELDEAIKRFVKSAENISAIKIALSNIEVQNTGNKELVLLTHNGTLRFALKQITHIEGARNYSYIYLSNGSRELSSKNLAHFGNLLSDRKFFRAHRSYLVNRYSIKSLKKDYFILNNGFKIPISRRKRADVEIWFYSTD